MNFFDSINQFFSVFGSYFSTFFGNLINGLKHCQDGIAYFIGSIGYVPHIVGTCGAITLIYSVIKFILGR